MSKLSKKSGLLFGVVMMICAFAVPSMASAASWSVVGTTHVLASADLGFTATTPLGTLGSSCADSEFDADVASASTLEITSGAFRNCRGTGALAAGCTVTATGTKFPWTVTAPSTTNIVIEGIHVDVRFETPPAGSCGIVANGLSVTLTGTLSGGSFDPSSTGANRRVTFTNATGVTGHSSIGSFPTTVTGSFRDTAGTLNLFD